MKPSLKKSQKRSSISIFKRKGYTEENLQKALKEISKGMSKKRASKTFNIPRSTLQFRIKHPDHGCKPGPPTILTDEEEMLFVNWIKVSCRKGFPKRKNDLIKSVSDFITKSGRASCFKNGEKWFKLFLARHPQLSFRTPEAVTAASSTVSEDDIREWFGQIRSYMNENNYFDILADPSRVFNGDETNFVLCPKTGLVLSLKGERNVYEVDHAQAKTSLTVMFTFGADGQLTPPMVIFPYKRLPGEITAKIPEDWGVGLSDNGWMNSDIFFEYIKNILYPHLVKTGTLFPIVLFVDGHKSHLTYAVSELCTSFNIILIVLYPNCTRLLQPADVAAFKPFKTEWQKFVLEWRRKNPSQALTKTQFVPLLKDTVENSLKPSTIINGFRATGLCPWNEDAVDYSKCLGLKSKTKFNLSQKKSVKEDRVLTKYDFIKIVGESAINRINEGGFAAEESSNYLKKIWLYFTGSETHLQVHSTLEKTNKNVNISNFDIDNMEIIFNCSPNISIADQKFYLFPQCAVEEIVQCSDEIDFMEDMFTPQPFSQPQTQQAFNQLKSIKQVSAHQTCMRQSLILQPSDQQSCTRTQQSNTHLPNFEQQTRQAFVQQTSIHQACTSSQQTSRQYATYQKPSIRVTADIKISSDQNNLLQLKVPIAKKHNTPVKLQDILVLPKTPKRKGVKNTTKTPFVLTSAQWKSQENEKIRIKEEKAEGMKKRKEERERKKLEKEKKPVPKNQFKNKTKYEAKDEVSKILFSEEFHKFENDQADSVIGNVDKENQITNKRKACNRISRLIR